MLKSTWRVLGISQTIHDTCYTWVLFRQVKYLTDVYSLAIMVINDFLFRVTVFVQIAFSREDRDYFCTSITPLLSFIW